MPTAEDAGAASRRRRRLWLTTAHVWHRRLGLAVAALVVVLSITGLLLNHGHRLELNRISVKASWLVDWYGLHPKEPPVHFRAGDVWVSWIDGAVYAGGRRVSEARGTPRGAVPLDSLVAMATSDTIVLSTQEGELVERLGLELLPGAIVRVGSAAGGRIIADTGDEQFASDEALLAWDRFDDQVEWSEAGTPPKPIGEQQLAAYQGQGLPLSRVLLDLHTGRLFGAGGVVVMDAAAVLLLVLVATGIVNWAGFRRRRD